MKNVILFVEGEGDRHAAPILVKKIVKEIGATEHMAVDQSPFMIGGLHKFTGEQSTQWTNKLKAAAKRKNMGGVLLLVDGDQTIGKREFCARDFATELAIKAIDVGAGQTFSVAVVFACKEYESWLLAGINSLAGKQLDDGRPGVKPNASVTFPALEVAPRDAKKELGKLMHSGYRQATDQQALTKLVELSEIRSRQPRSFLRLDNAVRQLADAFRDGRHIATPTRTL